MNFLTNLNRKPLKMGAIKDNNYTEKEFEIAHLFDALSHPARKRTIEYLKDVPFYMNTDLARLLNLSPASVMNHMIKLKRAKLVKITYQLHCYEVSLNRKRLEAIIDYVDGVLEKSE